MSKQIDEKTAQALSALGVTEDEIAELAEKNKALPPEENVVEKEESATPEPNWLDRLAEKIGNALGRREQAADASPPEEARKVDEVTPANEAEPAEEEKAVDEPAPVVPDEAFKAMGAALAEAMKAELDKRDALITELQEQIKALSGSIEDKVAEQLGNVPPGAYVAPSLVGATAVDAPETQKAATYVGALMDSVVKRTEKMYGGRPDKLEV